MRILRWLGSVAGFAALAMLCGTVHPALAQERSAIVVFYESGFLAEDSAAPSPPQLDNMLPGARFVTADKLAGELGDPATRLLVLPYGSAFPEESWAAIYGFAQSGGNLLVLGGRPFTRAEYRDATGWHLREYAVRFTRPLMIDQYQTTPGSEGLSFQTNPEATLQPQAFAWKQAFSPVIRLSAVDLYNRGGAAGSIDAQMDTLAWGVKSGRRMAAPLLQIDHYRNIFSGGRWIFLAAEVGTDFYGKAQNGALIGALAQRAMRGSEEFTARPTMPLYIPGEPVELNVLWHPARPAAAPSIRISTYPDGEEGSAVVATVALNPAENVLLSAPKTKGACTLSRPNCWTASRFTRFIIQLIGSGTKNFCAMARG